MRICQRFFFIATKCDSWAHISLQRHKNNQIRGPVQPLCWYILWFYQDASGVCKTLRERWHTCSWFPRLICFFYLHKWYCLYFSLDIYDALNQHCCKLTGFQMCYILAKMKFLASLLSFDLNSELFIYIFAGHLAIYFIYETMLLLTHLSKILFTQM